MDLPWTRARATIDEMLPGRVRSCGPLSRSLRLCVPHTCVKCAERSGESAVASARARARARELDLETFWSRVLPL